MELIGWIATLLILLSFVFTNQRWLRIINMVGAIFWVVWGFGTSSENVWVLNICIIGIHLYKLSIDSSTKKTTA